jgi:DMSO/TMAO reductase YedYZ molybdopterin-dependent catalytic subunit
VTAARRQPVARSSADGDEVIWGPTPLPALELPEIPSELHFVRNHFPVPDVDPAAWSLRIEGGTECLTLDLDRLRALPRRMQSVVLECAGHRRIEFEPLPEGVPWACGAVGDAHWTGTPLATLLHAAGIPEGAVEVVLEGADSGRFDGLPGTHHFARSLPLEKAFERDVLLAYEMNGEPIPVERGGPVRAIVPGWYATDSVKWIVRMWFESQPFEGAFQARDYLWLAPGETDPAHPRGSRMTELPIHALITTPADGRRAPAGNQLVRGVAWGGHRGVAEVQARVDGGHWRTARLAAPSGRYARVAWELSCSLDPGAHEIACRATDGDGNTQPERPLPNAGGYANNAVHRVDVLAG